MRCGLSPVSEDQFYSSPAVLIWSWVFAVLVYWDLFLCPALFLWGKVSDTSAGPMLSACCDGLLIIFQFCSVVWLWLLFTGSWDELCVPLPALFQIAAYHPSTVSPSAFPAFVYWKFTWRSATWPSPLLQCTYSTLPPLLLVCFQFLDCCSFFFFAGWGVSLSRGLCWFIPGVALGIPCDAWCSPVGLTDVSKAGL
jgi:hypothetical protein